jgi:transmembrane sensor
MTSNPMTSELLARYLGGEATPAERAVVEAWATDPANARELERLQAVWRPGQGPGDWDTDAAWRRVAGQLEQAPEAGRRLAFKPRSPILAMAAALLLLVGTAWIWRLARPGIGSPAVTVTQAGQQRTVDLPDGSRVVLAPTSELRVAGDYGRQARRVELRGEAWFEVEHDASRPFLVSAAGTITEDLGTEFLVRELPGGRGVEVVLQSGSASLRWQHQDAAEAVVLVPSDLARLGEGDLRASVQSGAPVDALLGWREGRLAFSEAPATEVARQLMRWFPVVVALDSTLASRQFTGTLQLGALDLALEVWTTALGVQHTRRADTVFVH